MAVATSTLLLLGAAAVSTGAGIHQAQTQSNYNNYLAMQAEADANAAKGAAQVEAERIRKQAKQQRAQAVAALAASGVDVNSATALKIDQQVSRDSEEDAQLALTGGTDAAAKLNSEASYQRNNASRAQTGGYVNAASSLLAAGSNNGKGWKRAA